MINLFIVLIYAIVINMMFRLLIPLITKSGSNPITHVKNATKMSEMVERIKAKGLPEDQERLEINELYEKYDFNILGSGISMLLISTLSTFVLASVFFVGNLFPIDINQFGNYKWLIGVATILPQVFSKIYNYKNKVNQMGISRQQSKKSLFMNILISSAILFLVMIAIDRIELSLYYMGRELSIVVRDQLKLRKLRL